MYRSLICFAPKRITFGQKWKHKRLINSIKNKDKINNIYITIHQCNTIEKLHEIQKMIDRQKEKIDKN